MEPLLLQGHAPRHSIFKKIAGGRVPVRVVHFAVRKYMENHENTRKIIEICENTLKAWKYVEINWNLWKYISISLYFLCILF